MSIKIYQYETNRKYGSDFIPSDNGDLDGNSEKEYVNVHFRVRTKGYEYPSFRFTEEERKEFHKDIKEAFTSIGWKETKKAALGRCPEWSKGKSHLYMHPQDFSGEVLKSEVKQIAEVIEKRNSFQLLQVDLYETVYDMSDKAYECILTSQDENITKEILQQCKTTRRNKFMPVREVANVIADKFRLKRIGKENTIVDFDNDQTGRHIICLMQSLIEKGYLVSKTYNNRLYVRTINKEEQRKKKLLLESE